MAKTMKIDQIRLPEELDRRRKLMSADKEVICHLYQQGYSQYALAEMYGVSQTTILLTVNLASRERVYLYQKMYPQAPQPKEKRAAYQRELRARKRKLMNND